MVHSIATLLTLITLQIRPGILSAAFTLLFIQQRHADLRYPRILSTRPVRPTLAPATSTCIRVTISNIETASVSVAGVDPDAPGKVNQDIAFHSFHKTGDPSTRFVFGGVLDGHGKQGHVLNEFLGSFIPKYLRESLDAFTREAESDGPSSSVEDILVDTFETAHMAARMNETVPAGRSGTTCVITVLDTEFGVVYTGNVGDSRSILATTFFDSNTRTSGDELEWTVMPLSTETTTAREDEKMRIDQNEGRIDSGGNVWYGPVAIAMTRALGDAVMKRAGIIPTPEVTSLELQELDGYEDGVLTVRIVIGSDGIFDVFENEEANVQLNGSSGSLQQGCESLIKNARRKWRGGLPMEVRIDDTSVAVMTFRCKK